MVASFNSPEGVQSVNGLVFAAGEKLAEIESPQGQRVENARRLQSQSRTRSPRLHSDKWTNLQ